MGSTRTLILIPAFNEEGTISRVINECKPFGDILVINDGSSDNTDKVALFAGAKVINKEKNEGYCKALQTGFQHISNYDYIVTIDADGEIPSKNLTQVISRLEHGDDLVLATRSIFRRHGEKIVNKISSLLLGVDDILCGLKGYRNNDKLHNLTWSGSTGTAGALCVLMQSKKVSQIPISIRAREISRFGSNSLLINLKITLGFIGAFFRSVGYKK